VAISAADAAPARPSTGSGAAAWRRVLLPLLLLCAWQLGVSTRFIDPTLVPAPLTVLQSLHEWVAGPPGKGPFSGTWAVHAWTSAVRVVMGFAIAAAAGTVVGIVIGTSRVAADLLDPLIQLVRPIPITAWVPFSVVFFGIRTSSAVFLIAFGAFFPVVVNAAAGARLTPRLLVRAARMLGTRDRALLWRVVLPHTLPYILTGWRLAMGIAWVLVVVSEMVAVKSGLGFTLWDAYYYARMDIIVCAMLSIGVLGYASDLLLQMLERRLTSWARASAA
jgi:NitT/TauT family transport system permease protein